MSKNAAYWGEIFEKASLCMDRIGNTRACYLGAYPWEVQERAEAYEERIQGALEAIGAHGAKKEDWQVVKAAAALYDELKETLPKADSMEPETYDRQMSERFRMIAERAAMAEETFFRSREESRADRIKEITDQLEQGIKDLFNSERYADYLTTMSKFHNYSYNNALLIFLQRPDASLVAGFGSWKKDFERHVKQGEKGIKILAPAPYKAKKAMPKIDPVSQKAVLDKEGKAVTEVMEIRIPAFKIVSVFDVAQTTGKELPSVGVGKLEGSVEGYRQMLEALKSVAPVPIGFDEIKSGAHGYYHLKDKRIAIQDGLSELQTVKTAIHEIAHAMLHDIDLDAPKVEQKNRPDQRTREVEAESIAYVVCQHYGFDTSDFSFGYVAGWSKGRELDELKNSLETIRATASSLISSIDERMKALTAEKTSDSESNVGSYPPDNCPKLEYIGEEEELLENEM